MSKPTEKEQKWKTPQDSAVITYVWAMPEHANPSLFQPDTLGNVNGGFILNLIDNVAGMTAARHVQGRVVTASIDQVSFHEPIKVGELIILKASVNRVFRTSLEVGVRVEAENVYTGNVRHAVSSYLTFVALDEHGKPTPIKQQLKPVTEAEKRRFEDAAKRRASRLALREQLKKEEV